MPSPGPTRLILRMACFLPLPILLLLPYWIGTRPAPQQGLIRNLDGITNALIFGKPVWVEQGDLRPVKSAWMMRMPAGKEVLIVGGSRAIRISGDWFRPRTAYNAAFFDAGLEDIVSVLQLCMETGKMPREIIFELNPTLTRLGKQNAAGPLEAYLSHALLRYRLLPTPEILHDLYAWQQLDWAVRPWQTPAWSVSRVFTNSLLVLPDGTATLASENSDPAPQEVSATVATMLSHPDASYLRWRTQPGPSEFDLKMLGRFLDDLQHRGIQVVVLLIPLNPVAYDFYTQRGGYDETWIRREMDPRGIQVVGSYSPARTDATDADFVDDVHARPALVRRLLRDAGVVQ
jgi:hypothetical protein